MPTLRKPLALHLLEGTRPKYDAIHIPRPRPVAPRCPAWLSIEAKREWKALAPVLDRSGLLTEADGTAFAAYCAAVGLMRAAVADQAATPGDWRKGVAVREAMKMVRLLGSDFGLNPVSRTRINLPAPDEKDDPMADLID